MTSPTGDVATVASVAVEVTASARRFARSLRKEVDKAFKDAGKSLQASLDKEMGTSTKQAAAKAAAQAKAANQAAAKAAKPIDLPVEADSADAAAAGVKASETAEKAAPPLKLKADVDRKSIGKMLAGAAAAAKGVGLVTLGLPAIGLIGQGLSALLAGAVAGIANLVPYVNDLAAGLVSAAGALLILPGAIAVAGVALGTLKLGFSGVGDALKAVNADAEAFEEAIADLTPNAQEFVRAIRGFREEFAELKEDIQERLFAGWADDISDVVDLHLPALQEGLGGIADAWNLIGRRVFRVLEADQTVADLPILLHNVRDVLFDLADAVNPLIFILRDLAVVGSSVLTSLTDGVGGFFRQWADRVSELRQSGELRDIMLDGIETLKAFGAALVDIGGIIKGVFGAAGRSEGGGLFGLLDRLNEFVNQGDTQRSLVGFFDEMGRIGEALTPILGALLRAIVPVAGAIADIAVETAPFLTEFIDLLGPALAALAPGFIALGPSVAALGQALMPVATILSDLVVAIAPGVEVFLSALAEGLEYLAPAASVVGEALGLVLEAVAPLLPMLGATLAVVLVEVATLLAGLAEVAAPLIQVFAEIGTELAQQFLPIVMQLAEDLLPVFAEAGTRILEAFEPLIPVIADLAEHVAGQLADALPDLVEAFTALFLAITDREIGLFQTLTDLIIQLAPEMPALVDAWLELAIALSDVLVELAPLLPLITELALIFLELTTPAIVATVSVLIGLLADLIGLVAGTVEGWRTSAETVGQAFPEMWETITGFFVGLYEWFSELPGKIATFLAELPDKVAYWFGFALGRALRITSDGIDEVVAFFAGLPGRASEEASKLWGRISGGFTNAVANVRLKGRQLVLGFINEVRKLPGSARDEAVRTQVRIREAFRNAKTWLYNAGKDIILGLANGITGAIGAAVDAAVSAANSVVAGVKDGLGISSPSRIFRDEVGRWIPAGIAAGIDANSGVATRAIDDLTGRFTARFSDDLAPWAAAAPHPAAPMVIDATGLDAALAEWFRGAVRTQGGGSVQQFAGWRPAGAVTR